MATIAGGVSLSSPTRVFANVKGSDSAPKAQAIRFPLFRPTHKWPGLVGVGKARPIRATPEKIADKVEESIKIAEETCAGGATDAECAAAWDEVEELSAEASHARQKEKESDPLENYCKENPETEECRTYDN
ncbi:calvin cycle protein CP12-2, chloroplastic-like [Vigna unguiculata]|uniref:calvin cycle protein CP12-2, chloroplastic-like n=1 Tax=Vigna unguiculata TaxID=3917 RepID=UPI001016ECA2|nr:calvin cycle protein CP12-2, chloroplastic-like [Vigna unguiculata]